MDAALIQSDSDAIAAVKSTFFELQPLWIQADPCDWAYITCDASRTRITDFVIDPTEEHAKTFENAIRGTIPAAIGDLSELRTLVLYRMRLTDGLPPELGRLQKLQILRIGYQTRTSGDFDNNPSITGSIPDAWQNLTALQELRLIRLSLTGS